MTLRAEVAFLQQEPSIVAAVAKTTGNGVSMRIVLVVDDEPMLRMLAAEMLEDAGHAVVTFDEAARAIAYCDDAAHDVSAVLTDINMPGDLDGLDLARHVRETRPQTGVIVTSGRYRALPRDMGSRVTFLAKPWTSNRLLDALGRCNRT